MAWVYVPESEDWSLDLKSSGQITEPYVTLSGIPMQAPLSWRGWKTRPWIRLLLPTILNPSRADRGVASWIASLRDTRASPSVSPENGSEPRTPGISGPTLPESSLKSSRPSAFSRMSGTIYEMDLSRSGMTFSQWVIRLRRACLARKKSALHTAANGSLFWPTPTAAQARQGQNDPDGRRGQTLIGTARGQAWPTVRAGEHGNYQRDHGQKGMERETLTGKAKQWPTARDWRSGKASDLTMENNARPLNEMAYHFSHQAPPTLTDGTKCSVSTHHLNPRFVEWLMGFPAGWTSCSVSEMQWSLWLRRMRFALSEMPLTVRHCACGAAILTQMQGVPTRG